MLKYILNYGLAGLLLLMFGCAAPYQVKLPAQSEGKIKATDVVVGIKQEEIYADINRSGVAAAGGGGLLLALIDAAVDSSRTDDAEKSIEPIRNALLNYDVNTKIITAINGELSKLEWLKVTQTKLDRTIDNTKLAKQLSNTNSNVVLLIETNYYLVPDFKGLKITSNVTAYANDSELKEIAKKQNADQENDILYRNRFETVEFLPGQANNMEEATAAWVKNNGSAIKQVIDAQSKAIAIQIANGLVQAREEYRKLKQTASAN